jgi:SAM-dependent methyltransferase
MCNMLLIKFFLMPYYYKIEKFVQYTAKEYNKKSKKILEIGAGECPYQKYFNHADYFSNDIKQNGNKSINYVGDIERGLNVKSENFDCVFSTQVLEHIKNPDLLFKESARILKKGGKMFLTTNFVYPIHMEPHDYYRFTKYGLKELGESNGFRVIKIKDHGGVFSVLGYMLSTLPIKLLLREKSKFVYAYIILFSPFIVATNMICMFLDYLDKKRIYTINYEVIYEKR